MDTVTAVLLILHAINNEIKERAKSAVSPDFVSVYEECAEIVHDAENEFINGVAKGVMNR